MSLVKLEGRYVYNGDSWVYLVNLSKITSPTTHGPDCQQASEVRDVFSTLVFVVSL